MSKKIYRIVFLIIFCLTFTVIAQNDPLVLGEFKVSRVIDGDTIAVEGLPNTIRFLCIDTEECEKGPDAEEKTREIAQNYLAYVQEQTRNDPNPKFNTPMGLEGKHFAEKIFPIGSTVRIEYDEPGRKMDYYGRNLAYVMIKKDDQWVNYNVECVRAGMSPYTDKYGPSKRFECDFLDAEREARINQRGIWNPYAMCYPNYDSRLQWWHLRGLAIKHFDKKYGSINNAIEILNDEDWERLAGLIDNEVILFGSVSYNPSSRTPVLLTMNHNDRSAVAIKISDESFYQRVSPDLEKYHDDMVYFKGTLEKGFQQGNRDYAYSISILSTGQFFVEIPGIETEKPEEAKIISSVKIEGSAIPWQDAPKYKGQDIITAGKIVRTSNIGNLTFLNFSDDFNKTITLVIFRENYAKFPELPDKMYKDRTIKVKGKVSEYQGKPQIVIQGPDQIEILE